MKFIWRMALPPAALALLVQGCGTVSPKPEPASDVAGSVAAIANHLAEIAERRVDLSTMRVAVREIHAEVPELPGRPVRLTSTGNLAPDQDPVSLELQHEFVVALSSRFNVLESELTEAELRGSFGETTQEAHVQPAKL